MQQQQDLSKAKILNGKAGVFILPAFHTSLRVFHIPVAQIIPEETIDRLKYGIKFVLLVEPIHFIKGL